MWSRYFPKMLSGLLRVHSNLPLRGDNRCAVSSKGNRNVATHWETPSPLNPSGHWQKKRPGVFVQIARSWQVPGCAHSSTSYIKISIKWNRLICLLTVALLVAVAPITRQTITALTRLPTSVVIGDRNSVLRAFPSW